MQKVREATGAEVHVTGSLAEGCSSKVNIGPDGGFVKIRKGPLAALTANRWDVKARATQPD